MSNLSNYTVGENHSHTYASSSDRNPILTFCQEQLGTVEVATVDLLACAVQNLQLGLDTFFLLYAVRCFALYNGCSPA